MPLRYPPWLSARLCFAHCPLRWPPKTALRSKVRSFGCAMTDCLGSQHAFMDALSGSRAASVELCPEYVLVTNKVVYVIAGKASDQLVPLAETTRFHFRNNEVLIRVDDARREARFHVREMILRTDWDRRQKIEEDAVAAAHHRLEGAVVAGT